MPFETIRTETADGILTVTLSRPEKLNAYNSQLGIELAQVFEDANGDDDVRVIVVTGEGRAFCAGADLSGGPTSFAGGEGSAYGESGDAWDDCRWVRAIYNCLKPSIAAINGPAFGVGFTMPLVMDMRIASTTAKFGPVFAKIGLFPEAAATWFLPRIVGVSQAMQWFFTAEIFDAAEAQRSGLVSEVVEPDALLARAYDIAGKIVRNTAPVSVAVTRQLFQRCSEAATPMELMLIDSQLNREAGLGKDVPAGVAALLAKQAPSFPGKVTTDMPPTFPWWTPEGRPQSA